MLGLFWEAFSFYLCCVFWVQCVTYLCLFWVLRHSFLKPAIEASPEQFQSRRQRSGQALVVPEISLQDGRSLWRVFRWDGAKSE